MSDTNALSSTDADTLPAKPKRRGFLGGPLGLTLLGLVLVGAIAGGVLKFRPEAVETGVIRGEQVHAVARGDLRISFTERGNIKAATSVPVFCELEGRATIINVVSEGTTVKKGDVLVELDSSELTQQLNQQQITVEQAEASLAQAQEQLEIQISANESSTQQAELDLMLAEIDIEKYEGRKLLEEELRAVTRDMHGESLPEETGAIDASGPGESTASPVPASSPDESPEEGGASLPSSEPSSSEPVTREPGPAAVLPPAAVPPPAAVRPPVEAALSPAAIPSSPSRPAAGSPVPAIELVPRKAPPSSAETPVPDPVPVAEVGAAAAEGGAAAAEGGAASAEGEAKTGDFLLAYKKALANVKIAAAEVARARNQKEWTEKLAEKGYVTGTELVADKLALQKAELNEQQARGALELFLAYTQLKERAKYRSAVTQARAALDRAKRKAKAELVKTEADKRAKESTLALSQKRLRKIQDQLEKTKILAPQDGMAVYANTEFYRRERMIEAGAEVHENQLLMNLPDVSTMAVQVQVHESWIDQVTEGLPAFVSIDALPNLNLKGRVTKVGLLPDSVNRWLNPDLKVYQTDITLEEHEQVKLLRPGMSAKVEVVITVLRDVIHVPRQSVTTIDKQQVCYVAKKGDFVPQAVQGGRYNEAFIEILSGLEVGDLVQLSAPMPKGGKKSDMKDELLDPTKDGAPWEAEAGAKAGGAAGPSAGGEGRSKERGGGRGGARGPRPGVGKAGGEVPGKDFEGVEGKEKDGGAEAKLDPVGATDIPKAESKDASASPSGATPKRSDRSSDRQSRPPRSERGPMMKSAGRGAP